MELVATESGFEDGLGGASNAAAKPNYHYVLFGHDPDGNGVYFEFDDQIHGEVNCVRHVSITEAPAVFDLKNGKQIVVYAGWTRFTGGAS